MIILFLHPCSVVLHLSAVVVGGLLRLLNASQDSLRKPQAYQALLRPGSPWGTEGGGQGEEGHYPPLGSRIFELQIKTTILEWTGQTNSNSIRRNANLQPSANFSENLCTVDLVGDRSSCCSDQILISLKTFDLWCPDHVNCLETSQCPASDPPHHIAFLTVFLWEVQHILQIPSIHSKSTSFSLCAVHVPAGWWISGYYLNYFVEEQHRRGNYVANSFWA